LNRNAVERRKQTEFEHVGKTILDTAKPAFAEKMDESKLCGKTKAA